MPEFTVKTEKKIYIIETTNKTPGSAADPASAAAAAAAADPASAAAADPASTAPVKLSNDETTDINEFAEKFVKLPIKKGWLSRDSKITWAKKIIQKFKEMMPIFRKTGLLSNTGTIEQINQGRTQEIIKKEKKILGKEFEHFMRMLGRLEEDVDAFNNAAHPYQRNTINTNITNHLNTLKSHFKDIKTEIKEIKKNPTASGGAKHKKTKRRTKRMRKSMRKTKRRHKSKKRRKR